MKKLFFVLAALSVTVILSGDIVFSRGSDNKRDAEKYCEQQRGAGKQCKVSQWVGCGSGWTKDKRFNKHSGKDWFACKPTAYETGSDANQKKCESYRKSVVNKVFNYKSIFTYENFYCWRYKTCKVNVTNVSNYKTFGGSGKDYYLCTADYVKEKVRCGEWCMKQRKKCAICQPKSKSCPSGTEMTKFFGANYGACVR